MRTIVALAALLITGTLLASAAARAQELGTQRVSGGTFEALAKHVVNGVAMPGDSELLLSNPIRDQIVPDGTLALHTESPLVTPSYVNVPVEVDVNGGFIRTVFVGYRVQEFVRTAVAAHDLVAGTVLQRGDVKMARVQYFGGLRNGMDGLVGRKLVCSVRSGAPVYLEETQTNQIVKAGSSVVLIVDDGDVSVVAEVVARTSGGLGDEVTVYNPGTNKTLSGTVVGPDRVRLQTSVEQL